MILISDPLGAVENRKPRASGDDPSFGVAAPISAA